MQKTVIVVAHPDDEILWFSSLLEEAAKVILVFGDYDAVPGLGAGRRKTIAELPYPVTFFDIPEVGSFNCADWNDPRITPAGLELRTAGPTTQKAYSRNFSVIRDLLDRELDSTMRVYSHNPWGEYGHEDHVQLFRILEDLQPRIGFAHYTSAYVSKRSAVLASRYDASKGERITRPIDREFSQGIAGIYERNRCWTWQSGWNWRPSEHFLQMPLAASSAIPEGQNLLTVSWPPATD